MCFKRSHHLSDIIYNFITFPETTTFKVTASLVFASNLSIDELILKEPTAPLNETGFGSGSDITEISRGILLTGFLTF